MSTIVRSLASMPPTPAGVPIAPALDPRGPRVVLGGADPLAPLIKPTDSTLFGPRGATLASAHGPLIVADTGHHRLMIWSSIPEDDHTPADILLGQPNFTTEGRNGGPDDGARRDTLNVPTGVTTYHGKLIVADAWNHRVLIWNQLPSQSHAPPDLVLGQADFNGDQPNRGASPTAASMHWPFATLGYDGRLLVADTGNRRILIWTRWPEHHGQPADLVLGQSSFEDRSDNGGSEPNATSFRWPHDLAVAGGDLLVTDAGNNRILWWHGIPQASNAPATRVLGQATFAAIDHNRGAYWPTAKSLNMPYAIATTDEQILVADTANSRLLGWSTTLVAPDPEARALTGQPHAAAKGDNRWAPPVRDSLCWPYGLNIIGPTAVVSDTGNHRICLWGVDAE